MACNTKGDNEKVVVDRPSGIDTLQLNASAGIASEEVKIYLWSVTPNYKKLKNTNVNTAMINADSIIKALNTEYADVYLEKLKVSQDTIYTLIKDATYLTEQMGTTGAEIYLAEVVLNLTATPGITHVNIELREGSHMQPGTWSLDDFNNYKEVK